MIPQDNYTLNLENLIVNQLLPSYLAYCKLTGVVPELEQIPQALVSRATQRQKLPLLLKPF